MWGRRGSQSKIFVSLLHKICIKQKRPSLPVLLKLRHRECTMHTRVCIHVHVSGYIERYVRVEVRDWHLMASSTDLFFWGRISHWTWSSLIVLISLTRWVNQWGCIFPSSVLGLLRSMASINVGSKGPSVGHLVLHIHWLSHLPITCFCKMGVSVRVSEVYCWPLFLWRVWNWEDLEIHLRVVF